MFVYSGTGSKNYYGYLSAIVVGIQATLNLHTSVDFYYIHHIHDIGYVFNAQQI